MTGKKQKNTPTIADTNLTQNDTKNDTKIFASVDDRQHIKCPQPLVLSAMCNLTNSVENRHFLTIGEC